MRTSKGLSSGSRPAIIPANDADITRPFDEQVLEKARRIARQYRVVIEPAGRAGYIGWSIEMPGAMGDGKTPAACIESTYRSAEVGVAAMLEAGQTPPSPSSKRLRSSQINVRVTAEEKLLLEEAAQQRGFQGISDFIRAVALRACHAAGA